MVYAVVLCGGRGERFWPKSRRASPKQFIALFGKRTLVQATSDRIRTLCPLSRQLFVAPAEFGPLLSRQLKLGSRNLVFEPAGRNTAPAIALAALRLRRADPEAVMVVLPADHEIADRREFVRDIRMAVDLARQGLLVTFGIPPSRPDTGYGYVQLGNRLMAQGDLAAHRVLGFREKPDPRTAAEYVAAGNYVWNSGMFVWRADVFLRAVQQHMPEFHAALERFGRTIGTKREVAALKRLYAGAPSISVDYAILEKAQNIAAVRATFDWDDLGSWLALERHRPPDGHRNTVVGRFVGRDVENCIIDGDAGLVAALGVRDLVIVRSGDAVLVAHRDALDGIKELLAAIGEAPGLKGSR
jgi:mannose-1-phosphate guanylyltransferase